MKRTNIGNGKWRVAAALRDCFSNKEIPDDFTFNEQSFRERCAGWAAHAIEQLEQELAAFLAERE